MLGAVDTNALKINILLFFIVFCFVLVSVFIILTVNYIYSSYLLMWHVSLSVQVHVHVIYVHVIHVHVHVVHVLWLWVVLLQTICTNYWWRDVIFQTWRSRGRITVTYLYKNIPVIRTSINISCPFSNYPHEKRMPL